jgi:hypothetical protein
MPAEPGCGEAFTANLGKMLNQGGDIASASDNLYFAREPATHDRHHGDAPVLIAGHFITSGGQSARRWVVSGAARFHDGPKTLVPRTCDRLAAQPQHDDCSGRAALTHHWLATRGPAECAQTR